MLLFGHGGVVRLLAARGATVTARALIQLESVDVVEDLFLDELDVVRPLATVELRHLPLRPRTERPALKRALLSVLVASAIFRQALDLVVDDVLELRHEAVRPQLDRVPVVRWVMATRRRR